MTRSPLLALFALISCALVATAMPYDEAAALYKRRFGQEHPAILDTGIRPLGQLPGVPPNGRFDQIAGAYISTLLAATDPCSRYPLIDEIITICTQFNCLKQAVPVAQQLAALEKNFNPFLNGAAPNFCTDAAQPKSQQVRCIVPVIDPAAGGKGGLSSAEFNAKATAQLQGVMGGKIAAASCAGKSVQQQAVDLGLKDCVGCANLTAGGNAGGNADKGNGNNGNNDSQSTCPAQSTVTSTVEEVVTVTVTSTTANLTEPPTATTTNAADAQQSTCPAPTTVTVEKTVTMTVTSGAGAAEPTAVAGNKGDKKNKGMKKNKNKKAKKTMKKKDETKKNGADAGANKGAAADPNVKQGANVQTFKGALLGAAAPEVRNVGGARPFQVIVDGKLNGDFLNKGAALGRSCDVQKNACATIVNSGVGRQQGFSVGDCDKQNGECHAAI